MATKKKVEETEEAPELITVKAKPGPDGKNRVGLWEQDDAHPTEDGEVFIAGDEPVEVARTAAVEERLRSGVLVEVGSKGKAEAEKPDDKAKAPAK